MNKCKIKIKFPIFTLGEHLVTRICTEVYIFPQIHLLLREYFSDNKRKNKKSFKSPNIQHIPNTRNAMLLYALSSSNHKQP